MSDDLRIRCPFHDGADLASCGCPPLDSPGALDYRALLATARAEIDRLTAELAAARAVPADVEAAIARVVAVATRDGIGIDASNVLSSRPSVATDAARGDLRAAIARAIERGALSALDEFRALLAAPRAPGVPCPACKVAAPPATVGGLLAAGEERESRAWSEKGKAPPGSCPFCASRISMVQRDGYFIARCSHRGCGAVGPRMRSVSRAADLFCQPPRREAQGMSCGPIVASPPRPRCSCTHEAGDSRCDVHPTCSECGESTLRSVDDCAEHRGPDHRGPLPKGG